MKDKITVKNTRKEKTKIGLPAAAATIFSVSDAACGIVLVSPIRIYKLYRLHNT